MTWYSDSVQYSYICKYHLYKLTFLFFQFFTASCSKGSILWIVQSLCFGAFYSKLHILFPDTMPTLQNPILAEVVLTISTCIHTYNQNTDAKITNLNNLSLCGTFTTSNATIRRQRGHDSTRRIVVIEITFLATENFPAFVNACHKHQK